MIKSLISLPSLKALHGFKYTGADPGFFLGGGAPIRNDVPDGKVKKIKSEYVYTKKKASSQGG